ncbi:MAG: TatD family hydrolase [Pseudomonadales bacterium]|nr:TatD family hydrolase [Halieaceae bacterium]MCP5190794.1 TatD family hydrolase [Pseudomonadales bacterium]MCP5205099.1 TatD family hydrolase [Pseudomonadales bacterium]
MSKTRRREIPRFKTPIIETHCHLDYLDDTALAATIEQCAAVGIARIVTIAVSPDNLERVLELTRADPLVWGTQGIHPHEAEHFDASVEQAIRRQAQHERIVAIGEIGLDYYYDHADRGRQRAAFERQLQIAIDMDLPVVIHTREADQDTRAILQNFASRLARRGVIHSFTSSPALAEFCLGEGFMLGFNGIATFNRADNVREIIATTPLERIVLETDSPYLTPVPYRGKPNAPHYLPFVAERVAQVKQLDPEVMLEQIYRNSIELFFGDLD